MPVYRYRCPECGADHERIRAKPPESQPCPKCGAEMARAPKGPGVAVLETLDNGIMTRPVERVVDQPRLHREKISHVEADANIETWSGRRVGEG